ncbi:MAG TPA: ribosome-associated translation inhibitor RaiA [Smithellaceae bacterium]|nr:ribosome-associated translation inhibitor RaiA [Smithellaceae bacterium]HOM69334.1 ribosome-associated translation inhibitor RaiA [Smithellaceae bacterium]HOS09280.1 ribosome-associated translation inhibitor RaiA [Smithellaceae bacterium]HOU04303.1 ribosome-associated translation inhibitor RaiA [Smithellaceae bacterium]HPD49900.1 ribosome-associated translation inhibitor RaiA [Smithellaceae bacterium]
MKISVTFRNTEGEKAQKDYAEEKIGKLKKYLDAPAEAHIVLSVEKFRNMVEINLSSNGWTINAKEKDKDARLAIDKCIDKIEKQIKKQKEKNRKRKPVSIRHSEEKAEEMLEAEESPINKVMETRKMILKPMSLDEAIMEIEETKAGFIIYRDSSSENVSVVYRRDDGNYALIETNS